MHRFKIIFLLAVTFIFCPGFILGASPNFIVFIVDDVSWDDLVAMEMWMSRRPTSTNWQQRGSFLRMPT